MPAKPRYRPVQVFAALAVVETAIDIWGKRGLTPREWGALDKMRAEAASTIPPRDWEMTAFASRLQQALKRLRPKPLQLVPTLH